MRPRLGRIGWAGQTADPGCPRSVEAIAEDDCWDGRAGRRADFGKVFRTREQFVASDRKLFTRSREGGENGYGLAEWTNCSRMMGVLDQSRVT